MIFQLETIGSNILKDSKKYGAPYLDDNVNIGACAELIGDFHIGRGMCELKPIVLWLKTFRQIL